MQFGKITQVLRNSFTLTLAVSVLSGCLSEEAPIDPSELAPDNSSEIATEHEIYGSVGDGPVVGASIRIDRNDGGELAQFTSDTNASYNLSVKTEGKYYPLFIRATGGTDLVTNTFPDFDLVGSVLNPSKKSVANVNPFSTLAVELAKAMPGGENKSNIAAAQDIVVKQFNSGLTTIAVTGPMTTAIGGDNIAEIVRSSEAVGETIRRTRDALTNAGQTTSGNLVLQTVASDLTDGVVDGLGGSRSEARTAAVSTIVSAQVLLETMANELHVNGIDATPALESAVNQVSTETVNPTLAQLTATPDMVFKARVGLKAAFAVTSDTEIEELLLVVTEMDENSSSTIVKNFTLPSDYRTRLHNAVLMVANGDAAVHEAVNAIARDGDPDVSGPIDTNSRPEISGLPASSVLADSEYSFAPTANDVDGDLLTFEIVNRPSWATFEAASGRLSGTPSASDAGLYSNIMISVSDGELSTSLPAFSISVDVNSTGNSAPQISGTPSGSVLVDSEYSFTPTATDPDGDTLTFFISGLPSWASFDSTTGQLSGTPLESDAALYPNIMISVSDGSMSASLPAFSISVDTNSTGNSAPQISGTPSASVLADNNYSFTPNAIDPDGDTLTFFISGLPTWATFDSTTGQLSGTPLESDAGLHSNIIVSVSDGDLSADLPAFSINVDTNSPSNSAPQISGTPSASIFVDSDYSFTPIATDPDGDALTYFASGLPGWARFDSSNGQISGTPSASDAGLYSNIMISVTDGMLSASLPAFSINVERNPTSNSSPQISGTPPASVLVDSDYSFTPSASDPDGDSLTFFASGLPGWARFDSNNGQISGTPAASDAGLYSNIMIGVTDGDLSASLPGFSINVEMTPTSNSPPQISGTPSASILIGGNYAFRPNATDADGDTLTFSVSGLPSWASFDSATGQLSGTPELVDLGVYSNITVTVSDGQESASVGPFSVSVFANTSGSVTLNWAPPVRNEDGSLLTDLAGYKLFWGTTPGLYTNSVTINNAGLSTYVVENLLPGTYEFVMTSFNTANVESEYSGSITIVVD